MQIAAKTSAAVFDASAESIRKVSTSTVPSGVATKGLNNAIEIHSRNTSKMKMKMKISVAVEQDWVSAHQRLAPWA